MEARARLSGRERRLLALVGVGLVVGLYASLAVVPLLQRYLTAAAALRAAYSLRPVAGGSAASLSARRAAWGDEADRLRARLSALEGAVPRRLDGVALLEEMETLAGGAGVGIRHVDLGAPAAVGGEVRQRVEVRLEGVMAAHLRFLAALDGRPWLMRVETCTLEAPREGERGDARAEPPGPPSAAVPEKPGPDAPEPGTAGGLLRMTCRLSYFLGFKE